MYTCKHVNQYIIFDINILVYRFFRMISLFVFLIKENQ